MKHLCDDNGPSIIYDSHLKFQEVSPDTGQYYQILKGEIKTNSKGLNIVYTFQQVQEEFELSNGGGITSTCTCSICGSTAANQFYYQALMESFEIRHGNQRN